MKLGNNLNFLACVCLCYSLLYCYKGVRLCLHGSEAVDGFFIYPSDEECMWNSFGKLLIWYDNERGKTKGQGGNLTSDNLPTTNPTWTGLDMNSGLQCEKPVTNSTTMYLLFMKTAGGHCSKCWTLSDASYAALQFAVCLCRGVTVSSPLQKEWHWPWEHFWVTLALFFLVRDSPVRGKLSSAVLLNCGPYSFLIQKPWMCAQFHGIRSSLSSWQVYKKFPIILPIFTKVHPRNPSWASSPLTTYFCTVRFNNIHMYTPRTLILWYISAFLVFPMYTTFSMHAIIHDLLL